MALMGRRTNIFIELWCLAASGGLTSACLNSLQQKEYQISVKYWILAPFLSEAAEARECQFFENWLMTQKSAILLKPLDTMI